MARWEPDARGRLIRAALELYADPGYEQATIVDIAARAGVTERTFFRYFADKREVLFDGAHVLQRRVVDAVTAAAPGTAPLDAVAAAFAGLGDMFTGRHEFARQRSATIAANPSLQERDLLKLDRLGAAVAEALRVRGITDPAAPLAAHAGVAAFRVAFERWLAGPGDDLGSYVREAFDTQDALRLAHRGSSS